MLSGKRVAFVLRRELRALVKGHLKRGEMRLDQGVRCNDPVFLFRMAALMPRVLCASHVVPRPAVEAALLDMGDVVRNEIVAKSVPLIGRAPQLSGCRIDGLAHAVADAIRVDLYEFAL